MGEMALYYGMADIALIGGSLLPLGGQNLIEAAACGCPVVCGPHMFNFEQAAADALARGAALEVADAPAAIALLRTLSADPARRAAMCLAAFDYARAHRGATERTAQWLLPLLP
jgi:3-deoxy-D-manno-octulosonic-acid transferase